MDWNVFLDGLGGAILGGLVTGIALYLTLRSERRSRVEAALDLAVARMSALAMECGQGVMFDPSKFDKVQLLELDRATYEVIARARSQHSQFSHCVFELLNDAAAARLKVLSGDDEAQYGHMLAVAGLGLAASVFWDRPKDFKRWRRRRRLTAPKVRATIHRNFREMTASEGVGEPQLNDQVPSH